MTTEGGTVNLRTYPRVLWRRKWWVVGCVLVGLLGATVYAFAAHKQYSATTQLLLEAPTGSATTATTNATIQVATELQLLTSPAIVNAVEARLGLSSLDVSVGDQGRDERDLGHRQSLQGRPGGTHRQCVCDGVRRLREHLGTQEHHQSRGPAPATDQRRREAAAVDVGIASGHSLGRPAGRAAGAVLAAPGRSGRESGWRHGLLSGHDANDAELAEEGRAHPHRPGCRAARWDLRGVHRRQPR